MAQMERTWIDTRSFDQITLETEPTDKYNHVVDMILRDNRIFAGTGTMYDIDIIYKQRDIDALKEERKIIQTSIQALKNPPKKKELKKNKKTDPGESDEEEVQTRDPSSMNMDRIYQLIGEQQELDKKVMSMEKELELQKAIQALVVKRFTSLNRLAKHYKQNQDETYLRKGVHWVCEYGDAMVEREKRYYANKD